MRVAPQNGREFGAFRRFDTPSNRAWVLVALVPQVASFDHSKPWAGRCFAHLVVRGILSSQDLWADRIPGVQIFFRRSMAISLVWFSYGHKGMSCGYLICGTRDEHDEVQNESTRSFWGSCKTHGSPYLVERVAGSGHCEATRFVG